MIAKPLLIFNLKNFEIVKYFTFILGKIARADQTSFQTEPLSTPSPKNAFFQNAAAQANA